MNRVTWFSRYLYGDPEKIRRKLRLAVSKAIQSLQSCKRLRDKYGPVETKWYGYRQQGHKKITLTTLG
jgi:hypothetical protein